MNDIPVTYLTSHELTEFMENATKLGHTFSFELYGDMSTKWSLKALKIIMNDEWIGYLRLNDKPSNATAIYYDYKVRLSKRPCVRLCGLL